MCSSAATDCNYLLLVCFSSLLFLLECLWQFGVEGLSDYGVLIGTSYHFEPGSFDLQID